MTSPEVPKKQPKTRLPRRRVAIGPKRPQYLHDRETDRMMMIVTALAAEVSALRDRLDSHEALAAAGIVPTAEAIEAFRPDAARAEARDEQRTAMLKRVYRVLTEEIDAIRQTESQTAAPWSMPEEWDKT